MKICYLCADPGIPILGRKGCSTHVRETTRSLQEAGHEVFVITPNPGEDYDGNNDIDIIPMPSLKQKWLGSDLRHYLYNRRLVRMATEVFRQRRPDVIYERYSLYSTAGRTLEQRFGLPRILEVNSFLVHEQSSRLHFPSIAHRLEKRIILDAPHTVVVSSPLRDAFIELGVHPDCITIMPMAVDIQTFNPGIEPVDLHAKFEVPPDVTTVGYVGTLTNWHGIHLIYQAAERLRKHDVQIVFIVIGGDAEKVEEHRRKTKKAGLDDCVRFVGSVPYHEVPGHIADLDIALIPGSLTWASPTKLFEFQAMGKPVIAPRLVPIEDAMTHMREGLLFTPDSVEEIVEHTLTLHRDPAMRDQMGRQARERVTKTHAWENNVDRIINVFNRLLKERSDGRAA